MRPLPSVNGMVNTSGSVPAARAAVKVGAVQLYSCDSAVIQGYLASNSLIWRFRASAASWVAPGRRTPTVMVTDFWSPPLGGADAAVLAAGLASAAVEVLGEVVDALQAARDRMASETSPDPPKLPI